MPKKKQYNRTLAVLGYLTRYGSINRDRALTHFQVWNLPLEIRKLKKMGHDIETIGKGETLKYTIPSIAEKYKGQESETVLSPSV
jgi:Helix-turn-helix domain